VRHGKNISEKLDEDINLIVDCKAGPLFASFTSRSGIGLFADGFRPEAQGGSPLQKSGVKRGMQLLKVNEISIETMPSHEALRIIKSTSNIERKLLFKKDIVVVGLHHISHSSPEHKGVIETKEEYARSGKTVVVDALSETLDPSTRSQRPRKKKFKRKKKNRNLPPQQEIEEGVPPPPRNSHHHDEAVPPHPNSDNEDGSPPPPPDVPHPDDEIDDEPPPPPPSDSDEDSKVGEHTKSRLDLESRLKGGGTKDKARKKNAAQPKIPRLSLRRGAREGETLNMRSHESKDFQNEVSNESKFQSSVEEYDPFATSLKTRSNARTDVIISQRAEQRRERMKMQKKGLGGVKGRREDRAAKAIQSRARGFVDRKRYLAAKLERERALAASKIQKGVRIRRKRKAVVTVQKNQRRRAANQKYQRMASSYFAAQSAMQAVRDIKILIRRTQSQIKDACIHAEAAVAAIRKRSIAQAAEQSAVAAAAAKWALVKAEGVVDHQKLAWDALRRRRAAETIQARSRGARARLQLRHRRREDDVHLTIKVPSLNALGIRDWGTSFHAGLGNIGCFVSRFARLPNTKSGKPQLPLLQTLGVHVGMYLRSVDGADVTTMPFSKLRFLISAKEKNGKIKTLTFSTCRGEYVKKLVVTNAFSSTHGPGGERRSKSKVEDIRSIPRVSTAMRKVQKDASDWMNNIFSFDDLETPRRRSGTASRNSLGLRGSSSRRRQRGRPIDVWQPGALRDIRDEKDELYHAHRLEKQKQKDIARRKAEQDERGLYPSWNRAATSSCEVIMHALINRRGSRFSNDAIVIEIYADDRQENRGSDEKKQGAAAELGRDLVGWAMVRPCSQDFENGGALKAGEEREITLWLASPESYRTGIYDGGKDRDFGSVSILVRRHYRKGILGQSLGKMTFEGRTLPSAGSQR
jgi:hypothetical protein